MTKEMSKRITSLFLALIMLLQIFLPQNIFAEGDKSLPQDKYVKVGMIDGKSYNAKIMNELNRIAAKNRKSSPGKPGVRLFSSGPYFGDNNEPKDEDKPKYFGNVSAKLDLVGLDGNEFQWKEIFGVDESGNPKPAQIIFRQIDEESDVDTGLYYMLQITKEGKYTWSDGEGKPTKLPLFSKSLKPYRYEVRIDERVSDKVKLLTEVIFGTEGSSPTFSPENADGEIIANITLGLTYQQIASTKFKSEWHTDVAETDRPGMKANFVFDDGGDGDSPVTVELPKNDKDIKIIRDWYNDFEPDLVISYYLEKTPDVKIDETTDGLTFEEADGVKTVTSGNHKFKYDFTYDVINGGKLTMTEILPVTFDANGGKFASIEEGKDQKIVKEVDYDGTLTDKAENPTKDRETFKGWSDTKGGTTPVTEDAFKNIKEAKTFYAIWDNNEITAEELEVKESFKDGENWINDFIPTLDQLKGQVTIADANGAPKALANDDKLEILDDSGKPIADGALKDALYEKLKEDDATEVSRDVIIKAKVTHGNGTTQEVDIPIKVIKNIYEAKTEEGKTNYVPEDYVKVTVDPTTKAEKPQKYFYYVNPKAQVVIPGKDPTGAGNNQFTKWLIKDTDTEYKLKDKPRHQFSEETTIEAQYVSDVVPANNDGSKPEGTPANFVKVTFVPTDKAKDPTQKIFYVNPDKEVTIPVNNPVGKQYYTFKEWKMGEDASGEAYTVGTAKKFETATTITATYTEAKNIIPYDPKEPTTRPDGYVRVTFEADTGLSLTESKAYYVKKNAGITLKTIKDDAINYGYPAYKEETGYKFKEWDKEDSTKIEETDIVVTAKPEKLPTVVPETKENGAPNDKPAGYKEVTFVIKTEDAAKGSIEGVTKFYVNPTEYVTINPPETKSNTGFEFAAWDKNTKIPAVYKDDTTITASFNGFRDVIPKTKNDDSEKPKGYVTVTFDIQAKNLGSKFLDGETTVYYVNPTKEVTLKIPAYKPAVGYQYLSISQDPTKSRRYKQDTVITIYLINRAGVIPSTDDQGNPNAKPDGYITVTFDKGEHGKEITGQTVYYVNPNTGKKLGNENIIKPTVKAETGWKQKAGEFAWDKDDKTDITGTEDIIVKAQYIPLPDVISKTKEDDSEKPEGYITVTFSAEENGKLTGTSVFYVNPNKAVALKDDAPKVTPNTGFDFAGWDTSIEREIKYKDKDVIKAKYNPIGAVIPKVDDNTKKPDGYVTVTFDKGANGKEITGTTVYFVDPNKQVTLQAPTVTANTGWKQKDGTEAWDSALTQKFTTENTKITAQYTEVANVIPGDQTKPEGYVTVTFKPDENGTLSGTTSYHVNPNVEVNLTEQANGLTKNPNLGFTAEGGNWDKVLSGTFKQGETFTFKFKALDNVIPGGDNVDQPKGYVKVEFVAGENGSLEGGDKTYYVNPLKKVTVGSKDLPIPDTKPAENYKFDNWYETIDKTEPIKNDKKFVARFKLAKVTMTYQADDKTSGNVPADLSYDIGTEIIIAGGNNLKKDNAVLIGWKIGDKTYKPGEKFTINADTTATAVWEAGLHNVDFNTDGGTHIPSQKVKHEDLIKPVEAPKKDGYIFTGWQVDGKAFDPATDKVTKDITLVAQYSKDIIPQTGTEKPDGVPGNFVLVEFKPGTNGTLNGTTKYWVNPTAGIKLSKITHPTVTAQEGWKHIGWDKTEDTEIKSEVEVTAQYLEKVLTAEPTANREKYVTVTFTKGAYGEIKPEDTAKYWVLKDEVVTLTPPTVTPNEGYVQKSGDGAWSPQIVKSYSTDTEHVAQYDYNGENVIPQKGVDKPENVPDNFVLVEFKPGSQGTIAPTETVKYWVNPTVLVTLPSPRVTPNAGYEQQKGFNAWDHYLRDIFDKTTVITAQYEKALGDLGGSWQTGTLGPTRTVTVVEKEIVKVPAEKVFRKEVRYMQGYNNYFRPTEGLTRAEAAQILANALVEDGYRYDPNFAIHYKDIVGNEWYAKAIRITSQANVFKGYDTGYFDPHKKITRAEWIGTLRRFQELERVSGNHMQVRPDHWAMGEIEAAYKEGWLAIYGQGLAKFRADEFIPRQEVAAVSNKAFNRVLDKTYIHRNSKNLINYKDVNPSMWSYEDILCASNGYIHDGKSFWGHKIDYKKDLYNINLDGYTVTKDKFQRLERR